MPIYEYRRKDGSTFEVIQKFSDDALTADPETGEPVERVYTAPAIHFKGSGFHNTDYGSKRRPKAGGDGDQGSSADSSTGETKKSEPSPGGDSAKSSGESSSPATASKPSGGATKSD